MNSEKKFDKDLFDWTLSIPFPLSSRPSWDEYFLLMAFIASRRSSCLRKKVGAVIVMDKAVISTGYNGAPNYQNNCLEKGKCYRDEHQIQSGTQLEKCRASGSHAESNAIALAAKNGHSTQGATLFIYGHNMICNMCRGIIANAAIKRVVHLSESNQIFEFNVQEDWIKNVIDT